MEDTLKMKEVEEERLELLSTGELTLFYLFIKRKFKVNFNGTIPTHFQAPKIKRNKRNEEMIKFVLKSYMKYLTLKINGTKCK